MLKSNFFSKNKNFRNTLSVLNNNLIHKVWVDLINERQHKTQGFLGKIRESHGINLPQGQ